jgi:hypothetical protein
MDDEDRNAIFAARCDVSGYPHGRDDGIGLG